VPYKPKTVEFPDWLYELSVGDNCLRDVLTEMWSTAQHARNAVRQRGDDAPRTCTGELQAAEGILESISEGRVPKPQLAAKAAQAVSKFDTALQCAQFLESDDSSRFVQEPKPQRPTAIRVLAARESSLLARRGAR